MNIKLFISGDNIKNIGGDKDNGITEISDFLNDMDLLARAKTV